MGLVFQSSASAISYKVEEGAIFEQKDVKGRFQSSASAISYKVVVLIMSWFVQKVSILCECNKL